MKNFKLFLTLLYLLTLPAFPQTVSTITAGEPDDGMAYDSNGNLYASSYDTGKIFGYTPDGVMFPFITTGIVNANGLAFDSNDNLYVADPGAQKIIKFNSIGEVLATYSSLGNPAGMIKSFDSDDIIFCSYVGNKISKLDTNGNITVISSAPELVGPVGLAYDENGNLFVGNFDDRKIYKVLPNGDLIYIAQVPSSGSIPSLGYITYLQGKIWATTMTGHKIYCVNPNAINDITLFAGGAFGNTDGDISIATFVSPNGIIPNRTNNGLYITDYGSKNIREISNISLSVKSNDFNDNSIQIYPNPSKDYIMLRVNTTYEKAEIYDVGGKLLIQSVQNYIPTQELKSGVYFMKVHTDNTILTSKFIKT